MKTRPTPAPGAYALVADHCSAELSVRHMVMKVARGRLAAVGGELHVDGRDSLDSWVRVDFDAASLTTGSRERDAAITGPDFLDTDRFPLIRFESTGVAETGAGRFLVVGDLYVRDLVGEVELEARLVGIRRNRVAFAATASLSRSGYGLTWSSAIEKLGLVVADTVKLNLAAEFAS